MNLLRYFAADPVQVEQCIDDLCDVGNIPRVAAGTSQVQSILQIVFAVIGAIALIYIILSGFKLVTSLGNPDALAKARQSILYAVIGLVVALSAELLVTLLLGRL